MIGATSGVVAAYLPDAVAREIYDDPRAITGGVFAPRGTALGEGQGFRVSGRWPFASGSEHCSWLMGGCLVRDDGPPRARMMLFPASDVRILDTWTVAGLCGTGSHDMTVENVLVPAERSVSLTDDVPRAPGSLYAFPVFGLLALGIAAVALGIARAAIDELVHLARAKSPQGSKRTLAERAMVQTQVAEAEALVRSGRAFLADAIAQAWSAAESASARVLAPTDRALLRLAATHATTNAARATDLMYGAGGGTSIYATSPLQRCFRDVHVATQHVMVAGATLELTGRVLLGLDTDLSQL
jgi:alkylation response protein AidB-like acyl-CoA dehydrogenase